MPRGLHHTTGITGDAQANVDFYAGLLGLRLVKRTVNHEDPDTLHLFYGDAQGRPGTLLSFFAWPDTARGRRGVGQAVEIGLIISLEQVGTWVQRFLERGVRYGGPTPDGERTLVTLEDPDGLPIVLVGVPDAPDALPWEESDVPAEAAVRGLHHVTFWSEQPDATGTMLSDHLGFVRDETAGPVTRYRSEASLGHTVLVRDASGFWPSAGGVGTLHHVAFRVGPPEEEGRIRERLVDEGLEVTPVREHGYFRSVYLTEPSGAIIELATDGPGFTADEPLDRLGQDLVLPPELEKRRDSIEVVLPTVALPGEPRPPKRDLGWVHRYREGNGPDTLLLLHGTGGNETSLLAFGHQIAPEANLLAVRGRSLEEGGPRFFRRLGNDRFDQAQLTEEADALAAFVRDAAGLYGFDGSRVISVGYSNGANIALASLVRTPDAYAGAVLLRPALVLEDPPRADLHRTRVLVVLGDEDPFLPRAEAVITYLRERQAEIQVERLPTGHALSEHDDRIASNWLLNPGEPT